MSKPNSKAKPASKRASSSSDRDLQEASRNRTLGVAAIGAVAAVAGAAWFGLFGPLFRAAPEAPDQGGTDDFQKGLTPTAGAAAAPQGGTAPAPVVAPGGGHPVPDLAADAPTPGTERAVEAFRPDPTAPIPPEERDALRPATGPAPSLVANRGDMRWQTAPSNTADA